MGTLFSVGRLWCDLKHEAESWSCGMRRRILSASENQTIKPICTDFCWAIKSMTQLFSSAHVEMSDRKVPGVLCGFQIQAFSGGFLLDSWRKSKFNRRKNCLGVFHGFQHIFFWLIRTVYQTDKMVTELTTLLQVFKNRINRLKRPLIRGLQNEERTVLP